MSAKNKIPVCVLVTGKNDDARRAESLESVSWAQETAVAEDGSWAKAVAGASCEWILSLEAGERVTPALAGEIAALFERGPDLGGYAILRRNFIGAGPIGYGSMAPSSQLRFFNKNKAAYDEKNKNWCLIEPAVSSGLSGEIVRCVYRDFTDAIAQLDVQTDLEAKRWIEQKRKIGVWGTIARTLGGFWSEYAGKRGRRDGVIGLFLAVNAGMFEFLSYAKYWEQTKRNT